VLSQAPAEWPGARGYVQAQLAAAAARLPAGFLARVCGAKPMVAECLAALHALGVGGERMEAESF
jgi:NAD(P)H-flavin reductase